MKWNLLTVGKPALAFARLAAADYLKRLKQCTSMEWTPRPDNLFPPKPPGAIDVVLDERGDLITTAEFVSRVDQWELRSIKSVRVLIGGADGHLESTRRQADWQLALSRFTLQHELALVVFLEQLYRVYTIKRGSPYHR